MTRSTTQPIDFLTLKSLYNRWLLYNLYRTRWDIIGRGFIIGMTKFSILVWAPWKHMIIRWLCYTKCLITPTYDLLYSVLFYSLNPLWPWISYHTSPIKKFKFIIKYILLLVPLQWAVTPTLFVNLSRGICLLNLIMHRCSINILLFRVNIRRAAFCSTIWGICTRLSFLW